MPPAGDQDSNTIIEGLLDDRVEAIAKASGGDVLTYCGPIIVGIEDQIKVVIEDIADRKKKLSVIIETGGGFMEVAERIAANCRYHYPDNVQFVVPSFAMSAGTVLVMSGDAILMDYSSVLGPIDPQVQRPGSDMLIPALGYIEQFNRLIDKSNQGDLSSAELVYLVQAFNPAELYRYEQERELSIALLKDWLVKYKFKNWAATRTRGIPVTQKMREDRAGEIAAALNDTSRWHSHSRGIPMEVLRRDLNLEIDDFGEAPALGPAIRQYFRLLKDYMARRGHYNIVVHTKGSYQGI